MTSVHTNKRNESYISLGGKGLMRQFWSNDGNDLSWNPKQPVLNG